MKPWGRLTLESNKIRMGDDVTSGFIFYTPFECNDYKEQAIPLKDLNDGLYDCFLDKNNVFILGCQWPNKTTPAYPRPYKNGLYFTETGLLYVGTIHVANEICKWQTRPRPEPYGCNNELGIFNVYNRLPFTAINRNSNEQWNYASSELRYADNSNLFRINWVDGIGDVFCQGKYESSIAGQNLNAAAATIGVGFDQDAYPINWDGALQQAAVNNTALGVPLSGTNWTNGSIGRHSWQAMEQSTNVPITFFGNNFACLTINLSL